MFIGCSITVWKNVKFTFTEKFFREINSLVTFLLKTLLSRNFYGKSVRIIFHHFHTVTKEHSFEIEYLENCIKHHIFREIDSVFWNVKFHSVQILEFFCLSDFMWKQLWGSQCIIHGNLLSHTFNKNIMKAMFLLKKLLKSWFHEMRP